MVGFLIVKLASAIFEFAYDGLAELDRGLDILLSGLAAQLGSPDGTPAQAPTAGPT